MTFSVGAEEKVGDRPLPNVKQKTGPAGNSGNSPKRKMSSSSSTSSAAAPPSGGPSSAGATAPSAGEKGRKKEIYTYEASWNIYSVGCSQKAGSEYEFRFAVGSFIEEYCNKVQVNK